MTITVETLKKSTFDNDVINNAKYLLKRRSSLEYVKTYADRIHKEVLEELKPIKTRDKKELSNWEHLYLCSTEDVEKCASLSNDKFFNNGFQYLENGCCPYLTAKSDVRNAERLFFDSIEKYIGFGYQKAVCAKNGVDLMYRTINLFLSLLKSAGKI